MKSFAFLITGASFLHSMEQEEYKTPPTPPPSPELNQSHKEQRRHTLQEVRGLIAKQFTDNKSRLTGLQRIAKLHELGKQKNKIKILTIEKESIQKEIRIGLHKNLTQLTEKLADILVKIENKEFDMLRIEAVLLHDELLRSQLAREQKNLDL